MPYLLVQNTQNFHFVKFSLSLRVLQLLTLCQCEKWFFIILTNISSFTKKVKQIYVSYLYFLIGELICSCYFGHLSIEILIFIDIYELFIYWEYLFVIFFFTQFSTCALFYEFVVFSDIQTSFYVPCNQISFPLSFHCFCSSQLLLVPTEHPFLLP